MHTHKTYAYTQSLIQALAESEAQEYLPPDGSETTDTLFKLHLTSFL